MTNLSLNLTEAAAMYPDSVAVRCDDYTLSFAELDAAAARLATFLETEGVRAGDSVGLMLGNIPAFAVVYYGILRIGAVVVPINPLLSEREVQFYLSNSGARILFGSEQFAAAGVAGAQAANARHWLVDDCSLAALTEGLTPHPRPVVLPDDATAVILHTSGTTGTPKGAELTHGGLNRNQAITARRLLQIGHSDVVMGCLPLSITRTHAERPARSAPRSRVCKCGWSTMRKTKCRRARTARSRFAGTTS
jgi:long-chain acyl-CoA synthetase